MTSKARELEAGAGTTEVDDLRLFSTDDAAKRLHVSPRMLQKLIASGELRSVRIGRLRRIPASEIRRVVAGVLRRETVPELEAPTLPAGKGRGKGRGSRSRGRVVGPRLADQIETPPLMRAESDSTKGDPAK